MSITGSWSLIISGENIGIDEIIRKISIVPSSVIRKGEVKNKLIGPSQYDVWVYKIKYDDKIDVVEILNDLLIAIEPYKEYIRNLAEKVDIAIRLYIQSDFAQIGLSLPANILKELGELNVKLELSILSWGGVEDEN